MKGTDAADRWAHDLVAVTVMLLQLLEAARSAIVEADVHARIDGISDLENQESRRTGSAPISIRSTP